MVYHPGMLVATPPAESEEQLDRLFGALSDSTRRSILTRLTAGEATMSELAAPFNMSLPGVSKHVAVLESAGLVLRWRSGRARRCRLEAGAMEIATEWLTSRAKFWAETLDSFAAFVENETPTT